MLHVVEVDLGGGRTITIESGKMAKQANGAVIVRSGETVVLVTACTADKPKVGANFFPLTVDYREYTYSAGRFPGGFIKREGRPTEKEVLTCRLIDRPLRPLFPEGYAYETQVIGMVFSADPARDPSTLAIIGAGASLAISDIPFEHVLGGVRVGMIDGKMIANPTYEETKASKVNIVVAGTDEGIVMVESGAQQATEAEVLAAIEFGHECCKKIATAIRELMKKCGKPKRAFTPPAINQAMYDQIASSIRAELKDAMNTQKYDKLESYRRIDEAKAKVIEPIEELLQPEAKKLFDMLKERIFRDEMLKDRRRPDGRKFDEIRNIESEVGVLPRTHGSALFTRGETQAMVTATLGTKDDEQRIELLDPTESSKRFMLHYNFPPFSVGEVGFMRGAGRREIGHGALAERALSAVIPDDKAFPYTMRVVSDILESNGSSSMASVCGATLSLMDAGVPISSPVAGIAMGLVLEGKDYAVLTDIAGAEDHYGDMDFKVAGTKDGITALQMDIKVPNVTHAILKEALEQARRARLFILDKMNAVIDRPRDTMSPYAPRIFTMQIPTDKIRELIGPGGKVIRGIVEATGCKIDVEDDGSVKIFSSDGTAADRCIQMVTDICAVAEVGKTYLGKVVRIVDFGAFVEIFPGTDGLLHISEISENRIKQVRDELKEGDQILVKVLGLEGNKIKLSRKAILKEQREKLKKEEGARA
ncbi:MAG TPA: polyribonucleotide nucleotidyltransferase [Bryobacteraceae bacterium]|jgi:polyribonucleotide nucleotidyltransferase|nr:polyribonucleotide nucleotidyltransferase [Bryobacteraceae bacterium]